MPDPKPPTMPALFDARGYATMPPDRAAAAVARNIDANRAAAQTEADARSATGDAARAEVAATRATAQAMANAGSLDEANAIRVKHDAALPRYPQIGGGK